MAGIQDADNPGIGGKGGPEEKYPRKTPFNNLTAGKGKGANTVIGTAGGGATWPGPAAPSPAMTPVDPTAPAVAPAAAAPAVSSPVAAAARIASLFTPTARRYRQIATPVTRTAQGYGFA